jgi:hypothetical protein
MNHICSNDEYRSQVGATNRPENIVIRCLSLSRLYLNLKVVDVFSFHLQIFHWFIARLRRYIFPRSQPMRESTPLTSLLSSLQKQKIYHY